MATPATASAASISNPDNESRLTWRADPLQSSCLDRLSDTLNKRVAPYESRYDAPKS